MCGFCYAEGMADVKITVGGKPALTVGGLAARYEIDSLDTMRSIIRRAGVEPAGHADGRTPVYLITVMDKAMAMRKGTPGRPRKEP